MFFLLSILNLASVVTSTVNYLRALVVPSKRVLQAYAHDSLLLLGTFVSVFNTVKSHVVCVSREEALLLEPCCVLSKAFAPAPCSVVGYAMSVPTNDVSSLDPCSVLSKAFAPAPRLIEGYVMSTRFNDALYLESCSISENLSHQLKFMQ